MVSLELIDGTPLSQARLRETPKGLEPREYQNIPIDRVVKRLGEDLYVGAYPVTHGLSLLQGHLEEAVVVSAPESVSDWVRGPLIDCRNLLGDHGVTLDGERHFAGFDPRSERLFLVSDAKGQDLAELVFTPPLWHWCVTKLWVETNPQSGGWGIATRSGENASIALFSGDITFTEFEIQPTIEGHGRSLELLYVLGVLSGNRPAGELEATASLLVDRPATLGKYIGKDGKELEVTVRATIVEP